MSWPTASVGVRASGFQPETPSRLPYSQHRSAAVPSQGRASDGRSVDSGRPSRRGGRDGALSLGSVEPENVGLGFAPAGVDNAGPFLAARADAVRIAEFRHFARHQDLSDLPLGVHPGCVEGLGSHVQ